MRPAAGGGSLVDRALARLAEGPAHTLQLAESALRVSGPPGAVSAAVFTLLAGDPRVSVDGEGVWRLVDGPFPSPLPELSCAVVDVETTGGAWSVGHRIIEIAVVAVDRGRVGEVWRTLVNPGRAVPRSVRRLTGITDAMVAAAPWFDHVAPALLSRLEGRVFVAHNAAFDWRFVADELLAASGAVPPLKRLCTVRMARRLLPTLRRRNLDVLSSHYGIANHARHRADGDALATARVLVRLLEEAQRRGLADLEALDRFLSGVRGRRPRGPRRTERSASVEGGADTRPATGP